LSDDGRGIGAIAASSPMVFFFLFSVVVIAMRQSDCCLSLDRMEKQPRGPSSNVETMMYVLGVAIDNSYLLETNKQTNQSINLRKMEL
jgi:hypothetical protein